MSDTRTFDAPTAVMRSLPANRVKRRRKRRWRKAVFPDLTAAAEFLAELETAGYAERRLAVVGGSFVVQWSADVSHPAPASNVNPLYLLAAVAVSLALWGVIVMAAFAILR